MQRDTLMPAVDDARWAPSTQNTHRRRPRARRTLIAMQAVMALNAAGGAWYAIGGARNVPLEWLAGYGV